MSTILTGGGPLLWAGGALLTAAPRRAFGLSPTPGYALARETPLASAKQLYNLPGLSNTTVATVFLVVNKATAIEDLRMICAILTQGDDTRTWVGYTGRGYYYNGGVTVNTYTAAFASIKDPTVLDNERTVLLTVKFGGTGLMFYLKGVLQEIVTYNGGPPPRPWSDYFMLGGEPSGPGYDWQGLISACYLYFTALGDADRARTEQYLMSIYPAIS